MKGVEGTPEEQERLASGNNNGSLDCKLPASERRERRSFFHSTRLFMVVFLSGWVLQGMLLTYFVSVTTTVEKLFKIESKTTGTLLAATEIGQICTALFLTYVAGRGHRPRWIGIMMLVLSVGTVGLVVPHVMYGTQLLDVHLDSHRPEAAPLCTDFYNATCDAAHITNTVARSSIAAVVIPWLFVCLLVVGVGQTGITTLGIPFIDDNVGSKRVPLYLAITIGIRVIGPALGFLLGALCTRVYVEPLIDPGYDSTDPRWVGAWWLGMVFISSLVVVLSVLIMFFPRQIKQRDPLPMMPRKSIEKSEPFLKGFFATIKRQVTNDILMYRTASSVFHLMPISGVYSFLPKYLEQEFRLPTHDANLVSGLGGILVMGLGIITSGAVILKLVPTARQVAMWTAITAAIYSVGMVTLMFVSCPEESFRLLPTEGANSSLGCSSACHCDGMPYNPVCGQDAFTYLSPCQAGCQNSVQMNNSKWMYYNCSCIDSAVRGEKAIDTFLQYNVSSASDPIFHTDELFTGPNGFAISGECGGPCNKIYVFIVIFSALMFVHASGEVGSVLLLIRSTDKMDKAMAMGIMQFAIGVFGNVPCPILFGAAIDAACKLRDSLCGVTGACASYDSDHFRHFFLGLSAFIMALGFCMDLLVWRAAGRIDMNPEDGSPDASPTSPLALPTSPLTSPTSPAALPPTDTQL